MNITTIEFSRLYSLGDYQNERIGFTAEVDDDEDPARCMMSLVARVERVYAWNQVIRDLVSQVKHIEDDGWSRDSLSGLKKGIDERKAKIAYYQDLIVPDVQDDCDENRYHHDIIANTEAELAELTAKHDALAARLKDLRDKVSILKAVGPDSSVFSEYLKEQAGRA